MGARQSKSDVILEDTARTGSSNGDAAALSSSTSHTKSPPGEHDDDSDDDECNCFHPFCGKSGSNRGKGSMSRGRNNRKYDPMGTPIPDTPPHKRRQWSSRYGGLESEGKEEEEKKNNSSDGQQRKKYESPFFQQRHHSTAQIHEGPHAEEELNKKYELMEVLGVGSTSTCHRCVERSTSQTFACKIIDKQQIESRFRGMVEQFETEIAALRALSHPNIIHLKDVFLSDTKIYIIMELMEGGELFDYVVQKGTLTEEEASKIVRKVTSALVYMHERNIIHRDLKPENLLLTHNPRTPNDTPEVKIIDFGLSKCMEGPMAQSFLGTRGYLAPEMLQRRQYTRAVDAWSLGVITYVLLCGCLPFDDDSSHIPTNANLKSKFSLRFPRWATNLSASAKDLLEHLLDINPVTRYSAEQALDHAWVTGRAAPSTSYLQSPSLMHARNKRSSPHPGSHKSPHATIPTNHNKRHPVRDASPNRSVNGGDSKSHHHHSARPTIVRQTSI